MQKSSVICTTYFSVKNHPNSIDDTAVIGRQSDGKVSQNDIQYIAPWYNSVKKHGLQGRIFYDNLTENFVNQYKTDLIQFIKVSPSEYSNNDWRFFCYRNYLNNNKFDTIFLTDASDVTVVNDPVKITQQYPDINIFVCKDSIKLCQFPYMELHRQAKWDGHTFFAINNSHFDLINMGVIGGNYDNILDFLDKFCVTRISLGHPGFNSDMWLGQYIFRYLMINKKLMIGEPFTSNFKQYENARKDVYFIHK
jgi:hypothetical protein